MSTITLKNVVFAFIRLVCLNFPIVLQKLLIESEAVLFSVFSQSPATTSMPVLIQRVTNVIFRLTLCIILPWIIYKLQINLFQCKLCNIFSKKHTWIIQPSKFNKFLGITTIILMLINAVRSLSILVLGLSGVISFDNDDVETIEGIIDGITVGLFNTTYFLYLISTLEYQRIQQFLIQSSVPWSLIICMKIIALSYFVIFVCNRIITSTPLDTVYIIDKLLSHLTIQILVTYLFIRGLRNVAKH